MKHIILYPLIALLTCLIGMSAEIAIHYDYCESKYLEYHPEIFCRVDPPMVLEHCECLVIDSHVKPKKPPRARRKKSPSK
jgi:hypothetical protein